jgi:lysylphosphatidylglycerol synthetase-like protein (DUF2156 family)
LSSSKADLIPYLEKYGSHCMAYTSLEPSLEYFLVEDKGYIAFKRFKDWFWSFKERVIVLADPICAVENTKAVLDQFLEKYPNVVFVQSSRSFAELLYKEGFQVNQFGIETDLYTENFDLAGKARAKLRQWRNKCQREGITIIEKPITDYDNKNEIRALSERWLDKKGGAEYSFLVRPLRYENEKDARYFWAYSADQQLIGFAVFDPIYSNQKIRGYYHNIDRIDSSAPHGTSVSIVLHALDIFKEEGVGKISLGMSPLLLQKGLSSELNHNQFTRQSFWYAFEKLNFIYPFQGNASHKGKFNGEQSPVYISTTNGTNLWQVLVMMKGIGMF